MPFNHGYPPLGSDGDSFLGTAAATSPYASAAAATNQYAALFGVGYGDRGYGQTTPLITPHAAGQPLKGSDWSGLATAALNMANFQGTATTGLPAAATFAPGMQVLPQTFDWTTFVTTLDANRLNNNSGASLSVTSGSLVVTRATTWGSGSTGITCEVTATFASEDAARFFFNSSGALTLVLAHPNTTTTQNSNWNTILTALGTITISNYAATRSGSGGTLTSLGYYNLTSAYQTILNGAAIGTGSYTANALTISAMVISNAGVNGGNGTAVKIKIVLTDGHTNAFSDTVALGTNASFGFKKAASSYLTIASPTYATVTAF